MLQDLVSSWKRNKCTRHELRDTTEHETSVCKRLITAWVKMELLSCYLTDSPPFFPPRGVVAFLSKCPISDLIHQHYLITKTPSNNLQTCFWFSTRRCHLSKPTLQLRKLDYWIRPGRVTGGSRDQPEVRLNKYEMPTHVITSPHSIRFDSMNKACKAAVNLNVGIY